MPNATASSPPPGIVHAAQRQCTSQLLRLPPEERAEGAWVSLPTGAWNVVVHCRQEPGSTIITQDVESHYLPNPHAATKWDKRQNSAFIRILPIALLLIVAIVAESNPRNASSPTTVAHTAHLSLLSARVGR